MSQQLYAFPMAGNAIGIGVDSKRPHLIAAPGVPANGLAGYAQGAVVIVPSEGQGPMAFINTGTPESSAFAPATFIRAMTGTQRDALVSPPEGLVIYNTTSHKLNVRVAAAWEAITSA